MAHTHSIEVRFNELDPYNHVNHSVYATYFEIGRAKAVEWCGLSLAGLQERDINLVIVTLNITFKAPASANDHLVVKTWQGANQRRATTVWSQQILRDDTVLATAEVGAVVANNQGKPQRPPEWLSEKFEKLRG